MFGRQKNGQDAGNSIKLQHEDRGPSCDNVPGHPWDEKGLQRQKGVGLLVGIQERRALFVPVMNRLQTAGQPRVNRGSTAGFVPPPVYIGIPLFVLAQGCAEAYQACRGVGVLVCIQSASRNEERLSSCWFPDMPCMKRVYRDK